MRVFHCIGVSDDITDDELQAISKTLQEAFTNTNEWKETTIEVDLTREDDDTIEPEVVSITMKA